MEMAKTFRYQAHSRNYNPLTNELGIEDSAQAIIVIDPGDTMAGMSYIFQNQDQAYAYRDGQTYYFDSKGDFVRQPSQSIATLAGQQFLFYSLPWIKSFIDIALQQDGKAGTIVSAPDTLINARPHFNIRITVDWPRIRERAKLLSFPPMMRKKEYTLIVDKVTLMPTVFYDVNPMVQYVYFQNIEMSSIMDNLTLVIDAIKKTPELKAAHVAALTPHLKVGDLFQWKLVTLSGDTTTFRAYLGKTLLVEFWFPYCTGCSEAAPMLNDIHSKYKANQLEVIGIEFTNAKNDKIQKYLDILKIRYPILVGGKELSQQHNIRSAPTIVIVDENSRVVYTNVGFIQKEITAVLTSRLE